MKFKTRILTFPLITIAVFLAGWAANEFVVTQASEAVTSLHRTDYPALESLKRLDALVKKTTQTVQSAAAEGDASRLDDVDAIAEAFGKELKSLSALQGYAGQGTSIDAEYLAYVKTARAAASAMLSGKGGDVSTRIAAMQAAQKTIDGHLTGALKHARNEVDGRIRNASTSLHRTMLVNTALGVIIMLVLGIGAVIVIRAVRRELGAEPEQLRAMVERLAAGDFTDDTLDRDVSTTSVLGQLRGMRSELRRIVASIRTVATEVESASSQIAAGNDDLSRRTQGQAASLEETASSMEQMTATVQQTAGNASQAEQLSHGARRAAEDGQQVVGEAVNAMREIDASSKRIADIVTLIDEIAFQTNLLALNAAVEAARAGEQGRGFAVVASEVRSLAQRCADAAKDIRGLIKDSAGKVESGSALVERSGQTLQDIVGSVKRVSDIIAEIAASSQEQASGIHQVNDAIASIDEGTQQNAAMVEQASAASHSMRERAQFLIREVAFFQLGEGDVVTLPASSSPAQPAPARSEAVSSGPEPVRAAIQRIGSAEASRQADANAWEEF